MDLADEARRASAHPADPARAGPCATTIADLAGTDAKVVFVACHETTIGSRNAAGKREMQPVVEERRNTCIGVGSAVSPSPHIAGDGAQTVENKDDRIRSAARRTSTTSKTERRKNNVQTKT